MTWIGWYRKTGRGRWRPTPPMETQADARELARQGGKALEVKRYDTCVCREGIDPNRRLSRGK
jgi:hypothetical protein